MNCKDALLYSNPQRSKYESLVNNDIGRNKFLDGICRTWPMNANFGLVSPKSTARFISLCKVH